MKLFKIKFVQLVLTLALVMSVLPLLPKNVEAWSSCTGYEILDIKVTDITSGTVLGTFRDYGPYYDPISGNVVEGASSSYNIGAPAGHILSFETINFVNTPVFYNSTAYNSQYIPASENHFSSTYPLDNAPNNPFQFIYQAPAINLAAGETALYTGKLFEGWCFVNGNNILLNNEARVKITVSTQPNVPSFTCSVSQSTATVDPGGETTYSINTSGQNGFNGPVVFTGTTTPVVPDRPTITFTNNGQIPPGPTFARVQTTQNTQGQTYSITFTGTALTGETYSCGTQLVVNTAGGGFDLVLDPTGTPSSPVRSLIGDNVTIRVSAVCYGAFTGPVDNMTTRTTYINARVDIQTTRLNCGESTNVIVSNTGVIPQSQQSTYPDPADFHLEDIIVTGQGQI